MATQKTAENKKDSGIRCPFTFLFFVVSTGFVIVAAGKNSSQECYANTEDED